tara:strand:- start:882 stop:1088 length:207 start_codon:yes stop_codon:yes gene_type:complete
MNIIANIVGRRHVAESFPRVLRHVVSKLRGGIRSFRKMPRARRREIIKCVVDAHDANRYVYRHVMSGR